MAPVFLKLDELGIEPLGKGVDALDPGAIVERIKRQGEAFRARWHEEREDAAIMREEEHPHSEDPIRPMRSMPVQTEIRERRSDAGVRRADDGTPRQASPSQALLRTTITQPAQKRNIVLEELANLDATFRDRPCMRCSHIQRLAITTEGVVLTCKECKETQRVGANVLQRLADRLMATCFSCTLGQLKSTARPYGNILICQNTDCGRNNSWQAISDRMSRAS
jgi:hypothetical protein